MGTNVGTVGTNVGTNVSEISVEVINGEVHLAFDDVKVIMSPLDAKEVAVGLMRKAFEAEGAD